MSKAPDRADTSIATRWPEVIVAGVLVLLAILVITDSLRAGIDWADDGPRSGYFPFYIGLLLLASSATVLITQLRRWRREAAPFIERDQARMVVAVFEAIQSAPERLLPSDALARFEKSSGSAGAAVGGWHSLLFSV